MGRFLKKGGHALIHCIVLHFSEEPRCPQNYDYGGDQCHKSEKDSGATGTGATGLRVSERFGVSEGVSERVSERPPGDL